MLSSGDDVADPNQPSLLTGVVRARPRVTAAVDLPFKAPPPEDRAAALETIRLDLGACVRCRLSEGRTHLMFGHGSPCAEVMFVGEFPGPEADRSGVMLQGQSGELLARIIETMLKLRPEDVYVTHAVKCFPPGGREPQPDEFETCSPVLASQIEVIRPKVIVALGQTASHLLLRTHVPLVKLRGHWFSHRGIPVMPTFAPEALLTDVAKKRPVRDDMLMVRSKLEELSLEPRALNLKA